MVHDAGEFGGYARRAGLALEPLTGGPAPIITAGWGRGREKRPPPR
jgi:hypothetical protein